MNNETATPREETERWPFDVELGPIDLNVDFGSIDLNLGSGRELDLNLEGRGFDFQLGTEFIDPIDPAGPGEGGTRA